MALIFVMVDGMGLAPAGPQNAVAASLTDLARVVGMPLTDTLLVHQPSLLAMAIDATLGVVGLPQSGSGHTAIYGGFNAAMFNGRHQPSYPTIAMRERLAERNMLGVARAAGCRVAWANAYLPGYDQAVEGRRLRHTAGTWSALKSGLQLRGLPELLNEIAISWDLTQQMARTRPGCSTLPLISATEAGARLVHLAANYDLVAFETYLPDLAGHGRIRLTPGEALTLVDGFLASAIAELGVDDTLVVTSDHGNTEDMTTRVHTRNPVPLIAIGRAVHAFEQVTAIDGLLDAVIAGLGR